MLALVTGAGMRVFRAVQSVISATQGIQWNRQLAMAQLAYEWTKRMRSCTASGGSEVSAACEPIVG